MDSLEAVLRRTLLTCEVISSRGEKIYRGVVDPLQLDNEEELRRHLDQFPYPYFLEEVDAQTYLTISVPLVSRPRSRLTLHVLLFVLTIATTLITGAMDNYGQTKALIPWARSLLTLHLPEGLPRLKDAAAIGIAVFVSGLPFSFTLLAILLCHEMGHFLAARRYGMNVSLPYFIPSVPGVGVGTFGAVIRLRSPILHRRALLDIGAAGPLAGVLVSIPAILLGVALSQVVPADSGRYALKLGDSLGFSFLAWLVKGDLPPGSDIALHPVAWAGWLGLFVTMLNLLPVGQLDGGHVTYALLGRRHRYVAMLFLVLLIPLGFLWTGWHIFGLVILFVARITHPPVLDERVPLGGGRKLLALLVYAVFALTFMPKPIEATTTEEVDDSSSHAQSRIAPATGEAERDGRSLPRPWCEAGHSPIWYNGLPSLNAGDARGTSRAQAYAGALSALPPIADGSVLHPRDPRVHPRPRPWPAPYRQ